MTESPAEHILEQACHATLRGAWVCVPQQCNRPKGMCPERAVWEPIST